jgi:large subunit ribosomal protein L25
MAEKSDTATLELAERSEHGSRAMRRLRRSGSVPGVIYGGDGEPVAFEVDARILRNTLAHAGAVLEVTVGSGGSQPVVVKELQRHPVRGDIMHADLLRIDMKVAIQTTVSVELLGADEAPGVTEGGVLSQEHREINVEALPGDIPDVIQVDVSHMAINDTLLLESVTAPEGVTFVDDPAEIVIATITPPTLEPTGDEIETETGIVGEDGEVAESQAEGDTQDEAEAAAGGESSDSE